MLIINRKTHTGFRLLPLVPTSVTLNDLEQYSPYFALFHRIW